MQPFHDAARPRTRQGTLFHFEHYRCEALAMRDHHAQLLRVRNRNQAALVAALLLAAACVQPLKLAKDDSPVVLAHQTLDAPNPSTPGPHHVLTLYYGSGKDKNRAVYRDSVSIKTKRV